MKIRYCEIGPISTNCYVLIDSESGECAAVDCALFDGHYREFLKKAGITELKYILLTHGHFDHISGVKGLKEAYGGEICIHGDDALCLSDASKSLSNPLYGFPWNPTEPDIILKDGDRLYLGKNEITVMHTPGHTAGSVCYMTGESMFCGDTLFRMSVGRTDLPGGDVRALLSSLKNISAIEKNYDMYPGHGELTTLDYEKKYNSCLTAKTR